MRHYNNHYSHSRMFYEELKQNKPKSLNLSSKKANTLEFYLEKLLKKSYQYLAPIFEGDEAMGNYLQEKNLDTIDQKTDEQLNKYVPQWLQSIIGFLINCYEKCFPKLLKNKVLAIKKCISNLLKKRSTNNYKTPHILIQNKALP